jgi:hypothetical protein
VQRARDRFVVLYGRVEGKSYSSLQMVDKSSIAKTMFMAFSVALEFQPAIMYLDQCEQVFGAAKKKKGVPAASWAKLKKPYQDFKKAKWFGVPFPIHRSPTTEWPSSGARTGPTSAT